MSAGAMELVSDLAQKAGKPAYVVFAQVAKHLPVKSEQEGRYIAIDVDMVTVRQLGATDSCMFEVAAWLKQNRQDVQAGRLPREHADYYQKAYEHWKSGQEIPLEGTPIKGWPVISPAQTEILIHLGIRTVEELSAINGEVMQRIGMGAVMLKNKAMAWVAQAKDKGPLTMEMAALKTTNDLLQANLATMQRQLEELQAAKPTPVHVEPSLVMTAEELFHEEQPVRKPGRPRKED